MKPLVKLTIVMVGAIVMSICASAQAQHPEPPVGGGMGRSLVSVGASEFSQASFGLKNALNFRKYKDDVLAGIFSLFGECVPVAVDGGRTWWVYYADGTITQNTVRTCRTWENILDAVFDGRGDCDWRDQYGSPVCYNSPQAAFRMQQLHGGVVDITHN